MARVQPILALLLVCFFQGLAAYYLNPWTFIQSDDPDLSSIVYGDYAVEEKRGNSINKAKFAASTFPCNGFDNQQICLHGGKGPLKRKTTSGIFCICLCRRSWGGPMCGVYGAAGKKSRRDSSSSSSSDWYST